MASPLQSIHVGAEVDELSKGSGISALDISGSHKRMMIRGPCNANPANGGLYNFYYLGELRIAAALHIRGSLDQCDRNMRDSMDHLVRLGITLRIVQKTAAMNEIQFSAAFIIPHLTKCSAILQSYIIAVIKILSNKFPKGNSELVKNGFS